MRNKCAHFICLYFFSLSLCCYVFIMCVCVHECLSIFSFCGLLMVTSSFDNIPHDVPTPVLTLSNCTHTQTQAHLLVSIFEWRCWSVKCCHCFEHRGKFTRANCVCVSYILFSDAHKLEIDIELISLISALR